MTFFFSLHAWERNLVVLRLLDILLLRLLRLLLLLCICLALILGLVLLRSLFLLRLLLVLVLGCCSFFHSLVIIAWGRLTGDGLRPEHRLKHVLVGGKVVLQHWFGALFLSGTRRLLLALRSLLWLLYGDLARLSLG